ncbi:MAG TPA: CHAT domain-containing protein [Candidatus Hypogeohydataceae bacterium YC41]
MTEPSALKVLVIASSPLVFFESRELHPVIQLDVEEEKGRLRVALQAAKAPIHCRFLPHATNDEIQMALADKYDVVHFTGHGSADGHFLLEDPEGKTHFIDATEMTKILLYSGAKLVFISACHSELAAQGLIQNNYSNIVYIDAEFLIADRAALLFAQLFYRSLALGERPSIAFNRALQVVATDNKVGDNYPLYDRRTGTQIIWSKLFKCHIKDDSSLITPAKGGEYKEVEEVQIDSNLPEIPYFTGREAYIYNTNVALNTHRLVTLTGPPGIGKSHLGLKVGHWHRERRHFPHGIYLVKLEDLSLAEALPERIASSMGLETGGKVTDRLLGYLSDKEVLLLLDNFETLLTEKEEDTATGIVRSILEKAPGARLLVTSRELLGLREWEKEVPVDVMAPGEARKVFTWQANLLANRSFSEDDPLVSQICYTLQCYPLPICLAASQLADPSLGLKTLHEALNKRMLGALNDPSARGLSEPERLRRASLRASLNLSYDRLSTEAKTPHLSVFRGGAGEHALNDLEGKNWGDSLSELADKNLICYRDLHYHQLAPVREFARETFFPEEIGHYHQRFAEYFLELAKFLSATLKPEALKEFVSKELGEKADPEAVERHMGELTQTAIIITDLERANIAAGGDWAYENKEWATAISYAFAVAEPFGRRGYWAERRRLLEHGAEAAGMLGKERKRDKASLLHNLAISLQAQGGLQAGKALL